MRNKIVMNMIGIDARKTVQSAWTTNRMETEKRIVEPLKEIK